MTTTDFERFVWGLKQVMDTQFESSLRTHGPLKINFLWGFRKRERFPTVLIKNEDGSEWVEVASSPKGKNLKVTTSSDKVAVSKAKFP